MKKEKVKLTSEALALFGNKIICAAMDMNIIYTINLENQEIDLLYSIPEENFFCNRLIGAITVFGDKIVFTPYHAKKIWIYDNSNRGWKNIQLNNELCRCKFWNACLYKNYIYMIPSRYPAIVRVNLDTYEIDEITECVTPNKEVQANYGYFFSDYVIENEKLYLASCTGNYILQFDMNGMKHLWKEVGKKCNQYVGMTGIDGKIWIAPRRNSAIVEWDLNSGKIVEHDLPDQFKDEYNFLGISNRGDLYLPSILDGKTLVLHVKDYMIHIENNLRGHTFSDWLNKSIYVRYFYDGRVLIDDNGNEKELYALSYLDLIADFILERRKSISEYKMIKENNLCDLQMFLRIIERKG